MCAPVQRYMCTMRRLPARPEALWQFRHFDMHEIQSAWNRTDAYMPRLRYIASRAAKIADTFAC